MNLSALVSELVKQLNLKLAASQAAPQGRHEAASSSGQRVRSFCCVFCSDPAHFLKSRSGALDGCPSCIDYIQKGLCKASESGQVVLPNGDRIHAPGKDIKEKLDNWHKTNRPSVSTNFIAAAETSPTAGFVWARIEEEDDDEDLPQITQREIEEMEILESLVTSTQKKIDNTKQRIGGQAKTGPTTRARHEAEKKTQQQEWPATSTTRTSEPQFKYHCQGTIRFTTNLRLLRHLRPRHSHFT